MMWFWYAIANDSFVAPATADRRDRADPLQLSQIGAADIENGACGEAPPTLATIIRAKQLVAGYKKSPPH
jgi:hypothetical protein